MGFGKDWNLEIKRSFGYDGEIACKCNNFMESDKYQLVGFGYIRQDY